MELLSADWWVIFIVTGLIAGLVDSIAGGGGLITLPVLLWSGMPPVAALGTNKLQGSIGTLTATLNFLHKGHLAWSRLWLPVGCAFLGSLLGSHAVQWLDADFLRHLLPVLLLGFALFFLFSPRLSNDDASARLGLPTFSLSVGIAVGFYDGFFGPGTGMFFVMACVMLLGMRASRATGLTKAMNFASNLAALLGFALSGQVIWPVGLAMGTGQLAGAWIGSHLVMRNGASIVRPALVLVAVAMALRLLFQA